MLSLLLLALVGTRAMEHACREEGVLPLSRLAPLQPKLPTKNLIIYIVGML